MWWLLHCQAPVYFQQVSKPTSLPYSHASRPQPFFHFGLSEIFFIACLYFIMCWNPTPNPASTHDFCITRHQSNFNRYPNLHLYHILMPLVHSHFPFWPVRNIFHCLFVLHCGILLVCWIPTPNPASTHAITSAQKSSPSSSTYSHTKIDDS